MRPPDVFVPDLAGAVGAKSLSPSVESEVHAEVAVPCGVSDRCAAAAVEGWPWDVAGSCVAVAVRSWPPGLSVRNEFRAGVAVPRDVSEPWAAVGV